MKEILEEFVAWLHNCGEDAFFVFDKTDEAISRFINKNVRHDFYDIDRDVEDRFVGKYKGYAVIIVRSNRINEPFFEITLHNIDSESQQEISSFFKDINAAILWCKDYIDQ